MQIKQEIISKVTPKKSKCAFKFLRSFEITSQEKTFRFSRQAPVIAEPEKKRKKNLTAAG